MKRIVFALTACLTAASCAGADDGKTQITLQRFFGSCEAEYGNATDVARAEGECGIITTLVNRFEAENPDVDVRVNTVFWPGYDQLTAQLAANDEPDIVVMHASVIPDYQARDLLEPLGEPLRAAGVDPASFTEAGRRAVTIGGRIYGMPFDTWAPLWHINLNLFREAGLVRNGRPILPRNPRELIAQAEQFREATGKPYFVQATANEWATYARNFYTFVLQQNADIFVNPRQIRLQTPEAQNVLAMFKELYERNLTTRNQDYSAATASFLNGGGGVYLTGTWMVQTFDAERQKEERPLSDGYTVVTYPKLFARDVTYADSHVWVMPRDDDRTAAERAAALRLLKFLADHNFQWARTGHLPAFEAVVNSSRFRALPHRANLAPLTTHGMTLPPGTRRQFPIENIIGEETAAAISGNKPIARALRDAEHRINELLDNI